MNEPNWNTTYWNFGTVAENTTLEFNFVYYNGDITKVETSCGCTATLRTKNRVTAELKTGKVVTEDKKIKSVVLTVTTSDGLIHKLKLKATVVK